MTTVTEGMDVRCLYTGTLRRPPVRYFPSEVHMPTLELIHSETVEQTNLQTGIRPHITSFDSGQEFSLEQLKALYNLLQSEDEELDGLVFDDACLRVL